jgi:hypothetical protein
MHVVLHLNIKLYDFLSEPIKICKFSYLNKVGKKLTAECQGLVCLPTIITGDLSRFLTWPLLSDIVKIHLFKLN